MPRSIKLRDSSSHMIKGLPKSLEGICKFDRKVHRKTETMSTELLMARWRSGRLISDPLNRKPCWPAEKKSRFIASVLQSSAAANFVVRTIAEDDDVDYSPGPDVTATDPVEATCFDGTNRLTALHDFVTGKIPLVSPCNDQRFYDELPPNTKSLFLNSEWFVNTFSNASRDFIADHTYLLNQGTVMESGEKARLKIEWKTPRAIALRKLISEFPFLEQGELAWRARGVNMALGLLRTFCSDKAERCLHGIFAEVHAEQEIDGWLRFPGAVVLDEALKKLRTALTQLTTLIRDDAYNLVHFALANAKSADRKILVNALQACVIACGYNGVTITTTAIVFAIRHQVYQREALSHNRKLGDQANPDLLKKVFYRIDKKSDRNETNVTRRALVAMSDGQLLPEELEVLEQAVQDYTDACGSPGATPLLTHTGDAASSTSP
jgi:hypothetical protein